MSPLDTQDENEQLWDSLEAELATQEASILDLSLPLITSVMSYLSARDVATAALACRTLRAAACDDILWKMLYYDRFEEGWEETHKPTNQSWKALYEEADREEIKAAKRSAPTNLEDEFAEIIRTKKRKRASPTSGEARQTAIPKLQDGSLKGAFREPKQHECTRHCRLVTHNGVEVCAEEHSCKGNCEHAVRDDGMLLVCPLNGKCLQTEDGEDEEGIDNEADRDGAQMHGRSRLQSFLECGYACTSEAELNSFKLFFF